MREIKAKFRDIHAKRDIVLPTGVNRLTTTLAMDKYNTWRKNVARGVTSSAYEADHQSGADVVSEVFDSIITPNFRSETDRVTFEQYQRFLVFLEEEKTNGSRKRSRDESPEPERVTFMTPSTPSFIGCNAEQLLDRIKRMKTPDYRYNLQQWKGKKYQLYMIVKNAISTVSSVVLEIIRMDLTKERYASADHLDRNVRVKYVMKFHDVVHRILYDILMKSGLLEKVFATARSFLHANRSKCELALFDTIHRNRHPRDCFLSMYQAGVNSGIKNHRDHVSFCTVVYCLKGNGEENLMITEETGQTRHVLLFSGDLIAFGRIDHSVETKSRKQDRLTINAFF